MDAFLEKLKSAAGYIPQIWKDLTVDGKVAVSVLLTLLVVNLICLI